MSEATIQSGLLAVTALACAVQALALLKVVRRLLRTAETLRDAEALHAFAMRGEPL